MPSMHGELAFGYSERQLHGLDYEAVRSLMDADYIKLQKQDKTKFDTMSTMSCSSTNLVYNPGKSSKQSTT